MSGIPMGFGHEKYGIFADSEALGAIESLEVEQTPEGLKNIRMCEWCSKPVALLMTWGELFCLQYGYLPQDVARAAGSPGLFGAGGWAFDPKQGVFYPAYRHSCHPKAVVLFRMTPSEARRHLGEGRDSNVMSDEQMRLMAGLGQVISQIRASQSGALQR